MPDRRPSDDLPNNAIPTDRIKREPVEIREEFMTPTLRDQPKPEAEKVKKPLTKEERRKLRKRRFLLTVAAIILAVGIALGFMLGRLWPDRTEVTFYATIRDMSGGNLLVEGIDENDVNHRSEMYLGLEKLDTADRIQTASGDDVAIENLSPGDLIRVTYDGTMLESFPLQLPNVWKIEKTEPEVSR